jgi:hypothetical protein
MKRFGNVAAYSLFLILLMAALPAGAAEYSGGFYFGDSGDGDGIIMGTDIISAKGSLIGSVVDYSGITPPTSDVQDVDGDGFIQGNDIIILKQWVIGNFANPTGTGLPLIIETVSPPPSLEVGDSIPISVQIFDDPATGDGQKTSRAGWGVIFELADTGCRLARLRGRDPYPSITDPKGKYIDGAVVFEYSGPMLNNGRDGGIATVVLYNDGCINEDITVNVRIPADDEAIPPGQGNHGRFPSPVSGPPVTVDCPPPPASPDPVAINIDEPLEVNEGGELSVTATCTYDNSSTDNCAKAGGITCTGRGDFTLADCKIIADQIPCGDGGSGTVKVKPVSNKNRVDDSAPVVVINDDIASTVVNPNSPTVSQGGIIKFSVARAWSDGCTESVSGKNWRVQNSSCATPGTITKKGRYTAGQGLCGGCSEQVNADGVDEPADVTVVSNATVVSTLIAGLPANVPEGGAFSFQVIRTWSDGCTEDVTGGCSASGDCGCDGGACVAGQVPCGAGGTCTIDCIGADNAPQTVMVDNDDLLAMVDVTPDNPPPLGEGESRDFACMAIWSDSCIEDCTLVAAWSEQNANPAPCGSISPPNTYTYANGPCEEEICATFGGLIDCETQGGGCAGPPLTIASVFPLSGYGFDPGYANNAHVDQHLTVIVDTAACEIPVSVSATCVSGGDGSSVPFTCDLSGLPGDPDVVCTPDTPLNEGDSYTCDVTATGATGSDTAGGSMVTALAAASPIGGTAGGYVGGLDYDSGVGVGPGEVNLTVINAHNGRPIQGKVYVQVWQNGGLSDEYFTNPATGSVTMILESATIDELTLAYKCGNERCAKGPGPNNYRDFVVMTWHDIDASDLVLPLELLNSAQQGRYKISIEGSIPEADFDSYIAPAPSSITLRKNIQNPARIRAGWVFTTFNSASALSGGLDSVLYTPDYQTSIALCIAPTSSFGYIIPATMPPNLILPDLVRTDWTSPCSSWAANPGIYTYKNQVFTPGMDEVVWSVGAYVDISHFVPIIAGDPVTIDQYTFPVYLAALGIAGVTTPSDENGELSGDTIIDIGTAARWRYDLREDWDNQGLGHDPDPGVDRKILFSMDGKLPEDPGRKFSNLLSGMNRLPNTSDAELWPDGSWDKRFARNNVRFISGVDFGPGSGLGITGLSGSPKIDDAEFTLFQLGYIQSNAPQGGFRDVSPWAGGADTETVSLQQAGINSTWADPIVDFTAIENGGPANYTVIAMLSRGSFMDTSESNTAMAPGGDYYRKADNPGSVISFWHVGPPEAAGNESVSINDFLEMPVAVAPSPDSYLYPAPQWVAPYHMPIPINRNGELWRVRTVDVSGGSDDIPLDGGRYYFEFTRPSMMNDTGRAVHSWSVSLKESDIYTGFDGTSDLGIVVKRQGQCLIDNSYVTGPDKRCKPNTFWKAAGPVIGASNIIANIPELNPGPAVLHGVTGVVPDLWDGISPGADAQLEWTFSVAVYNTDSNGWGLGGAFDWNNQDLAISTRAIQHLAMDSVMCYYQ